MSGEMTHVVELAEAIGPRPATTDAEADAADYIQRSFEERGLEVERLEFDSPRTCAWAYVIYHTLTVGAHFEHYSLRNTTYNTSEWTDGASRTGVFTEGDGKTETKALWMQDAWYITPDLKLTVGGRFEDVDRLR